MNRQQRKEQLIKELTVTLYKLGCVDTDKAIEAFMNFIEVTLNDEFGDK